MPRLTSISFTTSPRLPGMHGIPLSFDLPVKSGTLTGWKISLRAAVVLLRSPPGWYPGQTPLQRRMGDVEAVQNVTVYEVPRAWAALQWTWEPGETPCEVVEWDEEPPVIEIIERPHDHEKYLRENVPAEVAEKAMAAKARETERAERAERVKPGPKPKTKTEGAP